MSENEGDAVDWNAHVSYQREDEISAERRDYWSTASAPISGDEREAVAWNARGSYQSEDGISTGKFDC